MLAVVVCMQAASIPAEGRRVLEPLEREAYWLDDYSHPQRGHGLEGLVGHELQVHQLLNLATQMHDSGQLEKALSICSKVVEKDPENGEAFALMSKCYADKGEVAAAERAIGQVRQIYNQRLATWSIF
ncbi:hypothetical protein AB1Y20_002423 [Prymnesium parvum]|uniref:ER membrane protein complex subunit 2 n=1 Tax=Prymnesium parvum TaxID=97485 RepID=A0AB34JBP6_PRYPA